MTHSEPLLILNTKRETQYELIIHHVTHPSWAAIHADMHATALHYSVCHFLLSCFMHGLRNVENLTVHILTYTDRTWQRFSYLLLKSTKSSVY